MSQDPLLSGFDHYAPKIASLNSLERTFLNPKDFGGRVRALSFEVNTGLSASGGVTNADVVAVGLLPAGARPLLLTLSHEDLGADQVISVGTYTLDGTAIDDGNDLAEDLDVAAAGTKNTVLSGEVGSDTGAMVAVGLEFEHSGTTNPADDKDVSGVLLYVVNS